MTWQKVSSRSTKHAHLMRDSHAGTTIEHERDMGMDATAPGKSRAGAAYTQEKSAYHSYRMADIR